MMFGVAHLVLTPTQKVLHARVDREEFKLSCIQSIVSKSALSWYVYGVLLAGGVGSVHATPLPKRDAAGQGKAVANPTVHPVEPGTKAEADAKAEAGKAENQVEASGNTESTQTTTVAKTPIPCKADVAGQPEAQRELVRLQRVFSSRNNRALPGIINQQSIDDLNKQLTATNGLSCEVVAREARDQVEDIFFSLPPEQESSVMDFAPLGLSVLALLLSLLVWYRIARVARKQIEVVLGRAGLM